MELQLPKRFKKFLTATGVAIVVFVLAVALHGSGLFQIAELKTLDHRFHQYANPEAASSKIILVAVDEPSLEVFGRWPWARDRHGYITQYLQKAGARAIVFDVLFLEPDEAAEEFDAAFAEDLRAAGNVFLPYLLQGSTPVPPALKATAAIPIKGGPIGTVAAGVKLPISDLAVAAKGLGYINLFADPDGVLRRLPLLTGENDPVYAWTHLVTAVARYLLNADHAIVGPRAITLGTSTIPVTADGDLVIDWHGDLKETYKSYSAGAVLKSFSEIERGDRPSLDPGLFKDAIVFVAGTAAGTYDLRVTPVSPFAPGVLIHMTALDNILRGAFMREGPVPLFFATMLIVCLATAWSFMLLQNQVLKFTVVLGLAVVYYALVVHAFKSHGLWLELAFPEAAIGVTFALAASVEYLTEGRQRRQIRAAFDKYMAPEVVDEIMRHPDIKLGGERKELSILFSDIAGFTTISERLQPEGLVELLNEYLSVMTDIVRQQRGNVNKYLGDGIMAIFGAPLGEPTHATLACYAALDSQAALTKLRVDWKTRGRPEIAARIGINTGDVVVGNMGSQTRLEYTVMGDNVNLASRLEGANKFYDTPILIGRRTYELAQADVEVREVDLLRVKGKLEPVVVYELLARKGQLDPLKQKVVQGYMEGLRAYKARDFAQARNQFEATLKLDPLDGPSRVYLRRSEEFLAKPPSVDWDGIYELHSK
jgi:adenylate cyclase